MKRWRERGSEGGIEGLTWGGRVEERKVKGWEGEGRVGGLRKGGTKDGG